MRLRVIAVVGLLVLVLIGAAFVLLRPRIDPVGRAVLDALPADPALRMNELIEQANPTASEARWEDLESLFAMREAWDQALLQGLTVDDPIPLVEVNLITYGPWPRETHTEGAAHVARLRSDGFFDALCEMCDGPLPVLLWSAGAPVESAGAAQLDAGRDLRAVTRVTWAEMRLAATEGRAPDLICAVEGVMMLGEAAGAGQTILDVLVCHAIQAGTLSEIRQLAVETELDEQTLEAIDDVVAERFLHVDWGVLLEMERLQALVAITRWEASDPATATAFAADVDAFYKQAMSQISETTLTTELKASVLAEPSDFDRFFTREFLDTISAETLRRTAQSHESKRLDALATRVVLAIMRYDRRHGTLPPALEALVPEFLDALPFDPFTSSTLRYRIDEQAPGGFVLYSVGLDGVDNGGRLDIWDVTHKAMNPEGECLDFHFVEPRRPVEDGLQ